MSQSRILGNEYSIWSVRDKHSRAYSVLSNERSKRMAEIAGVGDPTKAKDCLSCHAVGSTEKFISDGVSCEACHGPAEKWLGPHTAADNSHANNVSLGMDDTKDLAVRAAKCLGCHIGGKGRRVDHALIAAGHPDLVFELDTFSAALPRHWRAPEGEAGNTLPALRALAVGQAMALADGMRQLATDAGSAAWPEFVHLECYQCHHDLRRDSWRIARGYGGRKPGGLLLNVSRFVVLEAVARQAAGGAAARLSGSLETLAEAVASKLGDGEAIANEARAIAAQTEALAGRFAAHDFTSSTAGDGAGTRSRYSTDQQLRRQRGRAGRDGVGRDRGGARGWRSGATDRRALRLLGTPLDLSSGRIREAVPSRGGFDSVNWEKPRPHQITRRR